jgi:photosystem II stability/assembly factor-like uncharacterized protein
MLRDVVPRQESLVDKAFRNSAVSLLTFFLFMYACRDRGVETIEDGSGQDSIGTWQFVGLQDEVVSAIGIDPTNSQIVFAGSQSDFSAGTQGKLCKSTDGGNTWDTLITGGSYRQVIVDPIDHNTVYAIPSSILKSTDGGETWQSKVSGIQLDLETRVMCLATDPSSSQILYAGTSGFYGGTLYKSVDGGLSWRDMWANDSLGDGGICIAIDPNNSRIVYVGTAWRGLVVKSTDGRETWHRTGLGETGQIVYDLRVDSRNPSTVLAAIGFLGVLRSSNAGENWSLMNEGLPESISAVKIVMNPVNSDLYLIATKGDDGWLYFGSPGYAPFWCKLGIESVRRSYYYSDVAVGHTGTSVYLGVKGLYKLTF